MRSRRTNTEGQRGWLPRERQQMQHFCFPPMGYAEGYGEGSIWQCACNQLWLAEGTQVWQDRYPIATSRNDYVLMPHRWLAVWDSRKGPKSTQLRKQEDLYDWRPAATIFADMLTEVIELLRRQVQVPYGG